MRRKAAIKIATKITPLIGFIGTVVGMVFIFAVIERPEVTTPQDLMRGVCVGFVTTLALIVPALVALVTWVHFRGHSDDDGR